MATNQNRTLKPQEIARAAKAALGDIDIWDEKYDYLEHDHWLASEWSSFCKLCLEKGRPNTRALSTKKLLNTTNLINLNGTYDLYTSALGETPELDNK